MYNNKALFIFCIFVFYKNCVTTSYLISILQIILYYAFKNDLFEAWVTEISRLILIDTTGIRKEFSADAL